MRLNDPKLKETKLLVKWFARKDLKGLKQWMHLP